jgi:alkanesulfonate monooxygenase SsuD/methylene tetrahydromethanopterin reductase-like flavin-dependent oxidoreductase (luciferase family)
VSDERLDAMMAIWTQDRAEFHGEFVNFDPICCWPKPVTQPFPPLYVGGTGPAAFRRIARLKAGWIAVAPSADVLSGQLEELRAVAGDVPVTVTHMGEPTAEGVEGYASLGVERVLLELPTEPRDPTLRRLDDMAAQFAKLQ